MNTGVLAALAAAFTFGLSTPLAKLLVGEVHPVLLAGLLYAGAAAGLLAWMMVRRLAGGPSSRDLQRLRARDLPWVAGVVIFGGVVAPLLLTAGLKVTDGSTAALLLNLEGVLTALLAWLVFRENAGPRVVFGMALIVVASVLLSWQGGRDGRASVLGPLAIGAACLCWAIDNNLTRKLAANDAVAIAAIKGSIAGCVNIAIAFALGIRIPGWNLVAGAALVGVVGYGLSLVLFVMALRQLGTARTGAYFSSATFIGAALSLALLGERPDLLFGIAAVLMAAGIWLHVTERHVHRHYHPRLEHAHWHSHDLHHEHGHDFPWDPRKAHSHAHAHEPVEHSHHHYPDIHHGHGH
jgi:drug/metabolite transporter (DMT)-like permease